MTTSKAPVSTLTGPYREKAEARDARACPYTAQLNGTQLGEIGRLIGAGKVLRYVTVILSVEGRGCRRGEAGEGTSARQAGPGSGRLTR